MRPADTDDTDGMCDASTFEDSLDPADWEQVRTVAHRMVDDAIMHLRDVRDRSVWREMPSHVHERFCAPPAIAPEPLEDVYEVVHVKSHNIRYGTNLLISFA